MRSGAKRSGQAWKVYHEDGFRQTLEAFADLANSVEAAAVEPALAVPDLKIETHKEERAVFIRCETATVAAVWNNHIINDLSKGRLEVGVFTERLIFPKDGLRYAWDAPKSRQSYFFQPDRIQGLGWCWRDGRGNIKDAAEMADKIVRLLLDEVERRR